MNNPLDYQIGGSHHQHKGSYQPWLVLPKWLTHEQMIGYLLGEAIVYLSRFNDLAPGKGDLLDIQKARHTLEYLERILEADNPPSQERAIYYSHTGATGQPCTVQYRLPASGSQGERAFIRLDRGGGGFFIPFDRLKLITPSADDDSSYKDETP